MAAFAQTRARVLEGCRTRLRSPSPLISTPRLPIRRDGMRTRIVTPRCCLLLPLVCSSSLLTLLSLSFAGGAVPGDKDEIDFITIASTGDAADFGDLVAAAQYVSCCSDSHGGLQG